MSLHFHMLRVELASAVEKFGNKTRCVSASRSGTPSLSASDGLEKQESLCSICNTRNVYVC